MKKRTTFLLAVLGGFTGAILIDLFGFVKVNTEQHHYYANTAVVTEIDYANNLVTVEDSAVIHGNSPKRKIGNFPTPALC